MITHILASIALISGTITDFKRREVPHWVTMGLIAAAIATNTYISIATNSYQPILYSLIGGAVAAATGAFMHYTGQWGGADFLLLTGLGALFGLPLSLSPLPFFAAFMFIGIFAGAIYGMLYLLILVIIKRKTVFPAIKKRLSKQPIPKIRKVAMIAIPIIVLLAVLATTLLTLMLAMIVVFSYFTLILYHATKAIEEHCFIKQISVSKLVPGDWVCEDVITNNKTLIDSDKLITGLEEKHIKKLKEHNIKQVTVKEGIPFVPSFLLAYILTLLLHDWLQSALSFLL